MVYRFKERCNECPPYEFDHDPCSSRHFVIEFHWPGGHDLDTGVSIPDPNNANATLNSGFDCLNPNNPFFKSGDITAGFNLKEFHHVSIPINTASTINLYVHWHVSIPSPNQQVDIYVNQGVDQDDISVTPSTSANGCSVLVGEHVGVVTINANNTWTLTKLV